MRNLNGEQLEEKDYIKKCSVKECKDIMEVRLNMIKLRGNFKEKEKTTKCPAGCQEEDTTEHLMECEKLDAICGKIPVRNARSDLKDFKWLQRNIKAVKHRQYVRAIMYNEKY